MKKLFSFIALVATLSLNAQNDAALNNLRRDMATSPIPASMLAAGAEQVIFGAHVRDDRPAVSPRNPSPPASAHRPAANNGVPTLEKKGDKITMADGKVYVLCEDGDLHEVGEILTDAQGNRFKVMSDGSIEFISGPPALANNNASTSGTTVVEPKYKQLDDGTLLLFDPNVRVVAANGAASGGSATAASGAGSGDPLMSKKLAPNELVYDQQGNTAMLPISLMKLMIRRGYDLQDLSPTDATVAWMENRNGGLGRTLGVTSVVSASVASCGQTVVYNQRPGAVATYGTRGGDCWRPQWRR